jgi:hypothetical protein
MSLWACLIRRQRVETIRNRLSKENTVRQNTARQQQRGGNPQRRGLTTNLMRSQATELVGKFIGSTN